MSIDPSTKPGAGEPAHAWRNRDYDETSEARPARRRWLPWVAALMSLGLLSGMLWPSIKPLFE